MSAASEVRSWYVKRTDNKGKVGRVGSLRPRSREARAWEPEVRAQVRAWEREVRALPDSTHGYNDAHIDTALRRIVPALSSEAA